MRYATTLHGLEVSHLAYADDIIVFTQAKQESVQELIECLSHYAAASGQKINMEKSQFYVDEKHASWAPSIETIGGFQRGSFPFNYLGVPIFKGRKKTDMFLFLREKISSRIHTWSYKYLSFGGRLTLIKSTLGAIPLHVFQVLEPTKEALKKMEGLLARFFWGTTNEKKATHWISWDQICYPTEEGGLGIRKFEEMVEAFGMKLWIRFREQDSLWAKFMLQKYCRNTAPSLTSYSTNQSTTWKRMAKAAGKTHNRIRWALGAGEIHFWEDIWWGDKPISELCNPGVRFSYKKVKEFWRNGVWNEDLIRGVLEPLGVPLDHIMDIVKTPIEAGGKDTLRWTDSPHGNFSTSSAWEICRRQQPPLQVLKLVWNDCLIPSISIFVWRLLANRIPVDAKLQWRKVSIASKCRCCRSPGVETREHLFIQGEVAKQVWEWVSDWFPNLPRWNGAVANLERIIKFWHRRLCRSESFHVCTVVPCLVLWFLWSERNNHIHRGSIFTAENVLNRTKQYLQQLLSSGKLGKPQWNGCEVNIGLDFSTWRERPREQIRVVRWSPPEENWLKLNIDGNWSVAGAGAGGILRDHGGNLVCGFKTKITAGSRMEAALQSVYLGINMAVEKGRRIWIEIGEPGVAALLNAERYGAANTRHCVTQIRNSLKQVCSKFSYIPKEGNKAAFLLAQQGCMTVNFEVFDQDTATPMVKSMVRMDQLGLPNFRFNQ